MATRSRGRKATNILLFIGIAIVFAFFGLPSENMGNVGGGIVATVNKGVISVLDYQQAIDQREQMYKMFGNQLGSLQTMIKKQALEDLIAKELISQAAEEEGIYITNAEVRDYVVELPYFQVDGKFQKSAYHNILKANRLSASQFEEEIKKSLRNTRVAELLKISLELTNGEKKKEELVRDTKLKVEFAKIDPLAIAKHVTVTPEEVAKWQSTHEAEMISYYDSHRQDYRSEEQVKAKHILIKTKPNDAKSEDEALKKIKEIAAKVGNTDFGKLAQQYSEDSTKTRQGDLGFFGRGQMVPEFEQAAFTLPVGKVSDPIKTEFGYHLIKVEEKKPAKDTSFEQVKGDIAKLLCQKDKVVREMAGLNEKLQSGNVAEVSEWLKQKNIKWEESSEFSLETSQIPGLGDNPEFMDLAISLNPQKPMADRLVMQSGSHYLLKYKTPSGETKKAAQPGNVEDPKWVEQTRVQSAVQEWTKTLRGHARIAYNDRYLADIQQE